MIVKRLGPPFAGALVTTFLLLLGLRPVVDLSGAYSGETINAGGLVGIALACLSIAVFVAARPRLQGSLGLAVLAFFGLLGLAFAHVLAGEDRHAALVAAARLVAGYSPVLLLPLFSTRVVASPRRLKAFLVVLFLAATVPITIAWLQYLGNFPFSYYDYVNGVIIGRPSGGYRQPNSLGRILVFLEIVVLAYYTRRKDYRQRNGRDIFFLLIVGFLLISTVITTHRTSIIAAFSVLAIAAIPKAQEHGDSSILHRLGRGKLAAILLLSSVALASLPLLNIRILLAITKFSRYYELLSSSLTWSNISNMRGRINIWVNTLEYFWNSTTMDKIFGHGAAIREPHTDILNVVIKWGLVGAVLLICLYWGVLSYVYARVNAPGRHMVLALAVYLLIFSITLQPSDYPFFMQLWVVTAGLMIAVMPLRPATTSDPSECKWHPAIPGG